MSRNVKRYAAALCLLALPLMAAATPPEDPVAWLERMARAAHRLDYEGTFVYRSDGHMQSMRVMHSASPEGERERLVALNGPFREVLRDGDRVACLLPDAPDGSVVRDIAAPAGTVALALPEDLASLKQFYRFEFTGHDRIAARKARKVAIRPRDHFRYAHHYWIAEDSGLLLHSELVANDGRIVEEVLFTELTIHDRLPAEKLEPSREQGERYVWQRKDDPERASRGGRWQVQETPIGFRPVAHLRTGTEKAVEHLVFSDGLASVSVFIEPVSGDTVSGQSNRGALSAEVRRVGDHQVTVIGEVPPATVRFIAERVQQVAPDD